MRRSVLIGALGLLAAASLHAQGSRSTYLRLFVVDSLGHPVSGAEVTAVQGLSNTLGNVITDSTGRRAMYVAGDHDKDYELSTRRLGYLRGTQFIRVNADTMDITIKLRFAPQMLETVVVTPQEDLRRKRFYIDADAIAASERSIRNGLDVVTKLRPDMIRPPGQTCGLYYIWINGKRIVFPPINPQLETTTRIQRRTMRTAKSIQPSGQSAINLSVQSVLHSIKPEHIEEMKYVDCWDAELKLARSQGALFVVLKEGIAFRSGRGSYVAFDTSEAFVK